MVGADNAPDQSQPETTQQVEEVKPSDRDIAERLLRTTFATPQKYGAKGPRLRRFRGEWVLWRPNVWEVVPQSVIEDMVAEATSFNRRRVTDVTATLASYLDRDERDRRLTEPSWTSPFKARTGPDPTWVLAFPNGLLDLRSFVETGALTLLPTDPSFFTTQQIPYKFDPDATAPTWIEALTSWFGDDQATKDLLQEWFGYILTRDTSAEKFLMKQGPPRTGKGTTDEAVIAMLGEDAVGATTFKDLGTEFGLQSLVNKPVVLLSEGRLSSNTDIGQTLDRFLGIQGNDRQYINRKKIAPLSGVKLGIRFMVSVNEFPALKESSGALRDRTLLIQYGRLHRFAENPDTDLKHRISEEGPGILMWALAGLRRLHANGMQFTRPDASQEAMREFEATLNPMSVFVSECLDHTANGIEPKRAVRQVYEAWCREQTPPRSPLSETVFGKMLKGACPYLMDGAKMSSGGARLNAYKGIRIKEKWGVHVKN